VRLCAPPDPLDATASLRLREGSEGDGLTLQGDGRKGMKERGRKGRGEGNPPKVKASRVNTKSGPILSYDKHIYIHAFGHQENKWSEKVDIRPHRCHARIVRSYSPGSTTRPLTSTNSASSSKWHAWFASRCLGRRLSTWPTTAVSCPTALGALCDQLTFRLARCREHSAVTATELLQPRDLACGTPFQSSCVNRPRY